MLIVVMVTLNMLRVVIQSLHLHHMMYVFTLSVTIPSVILLIVSARYQLLKIPDWII
jgi:hypothetical protein